VEVELEAEELEVPVAPDEREFVPSVGVWEPVAQHWQEHLSFLNMPQ
jgi:hypothetical protein